MKSYGLENFSTRTNKNKTNLKSLSSDLILPALKLMAGKCVLNINAKVSQTSLQIVFKCDRCHHKRFCQRKLHFSYNDNDGG